ncbi:DNA-binding transcriptional regulator [Phyllobacterium phragmitis]|uniref:DNA-binding transcriptional regulator n=1 Tax=Phyllobacterium phragmitis TaxID=2670329 RepID=A0A2S9ITF6_9HYPH|nr:sugar-binding transcriptional regulator [Phyllobacterium phragmitis]PRD43798.1 DNA-binding transcriptional regulator [Phyllobacterium phragmitis]
MSSRRDNTTTKLDDAARAGWLYYIAGNTQDEIAAKLGISRQSAQRMVSLAVSEGLVKVRLDHPIANCLELASRLKKQFDLRFAEVVPTDPASSSTTLGVAEVGAEEMARWLKSPEAIIMAIGTGRTLKAAIEQLSPMECPQHKIVSLTGSIAPDGSAAFYNVIFNIADAIKARSFPMPLPVIASSPEERELLHAQTMIRPVLELAAKADVTFLGIGDLGDDAPLYLDGFVSQGELKALQKAGGVGEILGWSFDSEGRMLEGLTNERVASAPIPSGGNSLVIALAKGAKKRPAIAAAVKGHLINGLITDEATAAALLKA